MARAQQWGIGSTIAVTGTPGPNAPTNVTSITKDAGATLSFLAPSVLGSGGAVTSYVATPYIAGAAQATTTTTVGSAGSILSSNGSTYVQIPVTGLTNATAYTFSVHATNPSGAGAESAPSGANTPLSGLVFGDDFNGPAGQNLDPEWFVYNRAGYTAQSEIEYYLFDHCVLDGSSNLLLIAEKNSYTGPFWAGGNITQPWRSGACQSNFRLYTPTSGNTMTFETRTQVCPDVGPGTGGMWPGLLWLEGQDFAQQWKTDPNQGAWNTTGKAELDIQEWNTGSPTQYLNNLATGSGWDSVGASNPTVIDFSQSMHVFSLAWKPGVSVNWYRDGSSTRSAVTGSTVPTSGCSFFLNLYLQIVAGSATATQHCTIDYVRVYDQNLG